MLLTELSSLGKSQHFFGFLDMLQVHNLIFSPVGEVFYIYFSL